MEEGNKIFQKVTCFSMTAYEKPVFLPSANTILLLFSMPSILLLCIWKSVFHIFLHVFIPITLTLQEERFSSS